MSFNYLYDNFEYISKNNDIEKLKFIMSECKTERDKNLLMISSAKYYNLNFIKYLVENEYDIHCENDCVFHISLGHNKPDITRYIISICGAYDEHYYINEALVEYAHLGNIEFVKEMLDLGGDIHHRYDEAILWAAGFGQIEMVKFLLDRGAKIDLEKSIELAYKNNHIETVKYLENLN